MGATRVSRKGVQFVAEFESFLSCPTWDPFGQVWTIGYGETEGIGPNTRCWSKRKARSHLRKRLNRDFAVGVRRLINRPLRQRDLDALTSFVYNNGVGSLEISTLRRRWNAHERRCHVARQELPKWVHSGGQVLPGLVRRRKAEAKLICTGHYDTTP